MKCLILLFAWGAICGAQSCDPQPGAVNLARSGEASQSSNFDIADASKAIDGNAEKNYYIHPCAHTNNDENPWWRLNLRKKTKIGSVVIVNREDCCGIRLQGAQIRVGNSPDINNPVCGTINDVSQSRITVCCNGMEGQYITVSIPGRREYLTLCEVEVYQHVTQEQPHVCW
ncbi:fucolectin-6-like [Pelodytes ibericus]